MKFNKLILSALAGFTITFTSCVETEDTGHHYDNKLFFSASAFTENVLFKPGDANKAASVAVAIAKPESFAIPVTVTPAPELLETYKLAYYDDAAIILPKENYVMTETTTTITAGSTESPSLSIEFVNIGSLDLKTVYVLPVTIQSAGIDVLQSAKTYYYVFKGASLVNVVCNISRNRAYPDFKNDSKFNNLEENTMEILFKANSFPNTLNTLMGIEGNYLLRLGDAGVPSNQLQLATAKGNLTNSDLQFESGQWYHVAVTFNNGAVKVYVNGVEKLSNSVGMSSVSIGAAHSDESNGLPRCFWIGYSYNKDRFLDGAVSEVRIWNKALSAEEIQAPNHFYLVEPNSEGLIAYWKFDEGNGKLVKDYSTSNYPLTIENEPTWEPVSLPQ